jgi:hypothetical protein
LLAARRCRLTASSRNSLLVQSSQPGAVPHLSVLRSHFAVGRFLGCVVFPRRAVLAAFSNQHTLSSSFAFLQSVTQHSLARRPQPTSSSLGLLLPTALEDPEVHWPQTLPTSATFRLQGLVTLWAAYSFRARAGFVSHRRRSWDSPFGAFASRKVSATFPGGRTHIPFRRTGDPGAESAGPAQWTAVSGLLPFRESLAAAAGLVQRLLVAPLGFTLLGPAGGNLARALTRTPPTRFADADLAIGAHRRLGVSLGLRLASSGNPGEPGPRTGQPF